MRVCIGSVLNSEITVRDVPDPWIHQWRRKCAKGEVIIVRYADDFVIGFQYQEDTKRLEKELGDGLFMMQQNCCFVA